jgi:hypothetical protein
LLEKLTEPRAVLRSEQIRGGGADRGLGRNPEQAARRPDSRTTKSLHALTTAITSAERRTSSVRRDSISRAMAAAPRRRISARTAIWRPISNAEATSSSTPAGEHAPSVAPRLRAEHDHDRAQQRDDRQEVVEIADAHLARAKFHDGGVRRRPRRSRSSRTRSSSPDHRNSRVQKAALVGCDAEQSRSRRGQRADHEQRGRALLAPGGNLHDRQQRERAGRADAGRVAERRGDARCRCGAGSSSGANRNGSIAAPQASSSTAMSSQTRGRRNEPPALT